MPDSGWLDSLTLESFAKNELPVREILQGSVYYPASGTDGSPVMAAAIEGLRRPYSPLPSIKKMPERLECSRNNILINAEWSAGPAESVSLELDRAAVAVASALVVSCGEQALASTVAAAEGIVSHLTSLVLVDEASSTQEALPALRKVALPRADVMYSACYDSLQSSFDLCESAPLEMASEPAFDSGIRYMRARPMVSARRTGPLARNDTLRLPPRHHLLRSGSNFDIFRTLWKCRTPCRPLAASRTFW